MPAGTRELTSAHLQWIDYLTSGQTDDYGIVKDFAGTTTLLRFLADGGIVSNGRVTTAKQFAQTLQTLTDGATINWNLDAGPAATVIPTTTRILANPTNMVAGSSYLLRVIQPATGTGALTYGTAYKWRYGTAPALSSGANKVDLITFVSDGTYMYGVLSPDFQ